MRVRLEQVREEPFRWDETAEVSADEIGHPDLQALSPVHWRGEIRFVDPGFLLTATFSYQQTLSCQRCLEPVADTVKDEMQLLLTAPSNQPQPLEKALEEEELGVVEVDPEGELDLRPLLIEQIQLNVPMKPLCRPDCKGLCKQCGADLNRAGCDCEKETIDPRWKGLEAFQQRKKDH